MCFKSNSQLDNACYNKLERLFPKTNAPDSPTIAGKAKTSFELLTNFFLGSECLITKVTDTVYAGYW